MTFEHERVEIWNQLITTLDGISNEWGDLRIHPRFDDTSNGIVILVSLEAIDSETRRVDSKLNPAEKQFRAGLRSFKPADIMAITLKYQLDALLKEAETYLKQTDSCI